MRQLNPKFQFLIIGGLAFIIDVIAYLCLTNIFSYSPFIARALAFMIAVAITCFGNRYFTFADRKHDKFYKQYSLALVAGLVSLVPNMSVFLGLLHILPSKLPFILIAFSSGTALGIVSNYLLSDRFVFAVKH